MPNHITIAQKILFTCGILSVGCFILAVSSHRATSKASTQSNTPQIVNKTLGFLPEGLTQKDGDYILLLKNTYSKTINGYTLGIGPGGKVAVDLTIGSQAIAPGSIAEERIPISNLQASSKGDTPQIITILAVLFEDGMSDGLPQVIAETRDRRLGTKIQIKRILSLIHISLTSLDSNKQIALNKLKTQITSLSEEPESGKSPNVKRGLRSAKEDTLTRLQNLERSDGALYEELIRLKESIEKRMSRL
ncbi:MAG: hypothetical protein ACR2G4_14545 [Pyrinomonadaceae bacterium]